MQVFFKTVLIQFLINLTPSSASSLIMLLKDSCTLLQKERGAILQFSSFNTEVKGPFLYKKSYQLSVDHNPHVGVLRLTAWVGAFIF